MPRIGADRFGEQLGLGRKIAVDHAGGHTGLSRHRGDLRFALLAENDLTEYTLSSPAVSEGQIFIRTASFLYAIGERRQ